MKYCPRMELANMPLDVELHRLQLESSQTLVPWRIHRACSLCLLGTRGWGLQFVSIGYQGVGLTVYVNWVPGGGACSLCPLGTRGRSSQFVSVGYQGAGLAVCVRWVPGGGACNLCTHTV